MLVLAKGVGATHLVAVHDRRPRLRARAGRAAGRGAGAARERGHPYALRRRATASAAALEWFKAGAAARSRLRLHRRRSTRTCCCRPRSARRGRRRVVPETMAGRRPARRASAVLVVGLPRAEGLPRRRCWPTTCARCRDRGARGRARPRARGARRRQLARLRARVRRRRRSAPRGRGARGRGCGAARARRVPGGARASRTRTRSGRDLQRRARAAGVRGADAAAVGARACACSRCLREALRRAGGRVVLNNGRRRRRARGRRASPRVRARVGLREQRHGADWVVLATGGFAVRRARARLALAGARGRRSACRSAGVPEPGEARFAPGYFDEQPMARAGVAVDAACGPVGTATPVRTCWSRAPRSPAPSRGARSPATASALATGHRAAELIAAAQAPGARSRRRRMRVTHDVLGELMRDSLDHCVKCTICETFCPVSNVTPLFPGPEVRGPAGGALPRRRRDVARRVARLLLELRDLHPGLPAGRPHRRDQLAGAARSSRQRTGIQAARPAARAARRSPARLGTPVAPIANWSLVQPAACARRSSRRSASTATPRCRSSPGARSSAGRASTPRRRRQRRVAYFHGCGANYYEPRHRAQRPSSCSSTTAARSTCPSRQRCCGLPLQSNGMFDDARAVRAAGWPSTLAPSARAGVDIVGTSTSCTLMLKREAREILGMEDDAELRAVSDARVRHLRVPARAARPRRAAHRLPRRCR